MCGWRGSIWSIDWLSPSTYRIKSQLYSSNCSYGEQTPNSFYLKGAWRQWMEVNHIERNNQWKLFLLIYYYTWNHIYKKQNLAINSIEELINEITNQSRDLIYEWKCIFEQLSYFLLSLFGVYLVLFQGSFLSHPYIHHWMESCTYRSWRWFFPVLVFVFLLWFFLKIFFFFGRYLYYVRATLRYYPDNV